MKFILNIIFLCTFYFTAYSQQLGIAGGYCINNFYDFHKDEGHFKSNYSQGSGYAFNINLDEVLLDTFIFRFALNFARYDGSIYIRDGGLGGFTTENAYVEKYVVGLTTFPINIKIFKEFKINIGGDFNYLVYSNITGTRISYSANGGGNTIDFKNKSPDILKEYNFGILGRLSYNIRFYKKWYLVPEYNYYWGLTNEFVNFNAKVKSKRNYFMIGVINRIKSAK